MTDLEILKEKEEAYFFVLQKFVSRLERIISLWNRIYLDKKIFIDLSLCSFEENSKFLILKEKTLCSHSFDLEDIEYYKEKVIEIPKSFIDNFEYFDKHILFIEELYSLRNEARKLSFDDYYFLPYSLSAKLDKRFAIDSNLSKKSKELGLKIGLLKKEGLDATELLKENTILTTKIKEWKKFRTQRIHLIQLRLDRDAKQKRAERLIEVNKRIQILESLIGPF